jgi:hypothetical protein
MTSKSSKSNKLKLLGYTVLVGGLVVASGWFYWQYISKTPERVAAQFMNQIDKYGNDTRAYALTSAAYKQNAQFADFVTHFQPLDKSEAKYSVNGQAVKGSNALVGGVVEDLNGSNFYYIIDLVKTTGGWQINSITSAPQ